MSAIHDKLQRAEKYLEAWQVDHAAAMECFALEDWLFEGVAVYDKFVVPADQHVRRLVFRAVVELPAGALRALYEHWLEIATSGLPALAKLEREFETVQHAEEFRSRVENAKQVLATWRDPVKALSPGLHVWKVTPEEAEQLEALSKAKKGDPGTLARDLRPMQPGDPSLIR